MPKEPPSRRLSKSHTIILVAAILISNLSTAIDSSISASSHVAVASAFSRTNLSSWPVNAFYLMATIFQPLYARVSDHLGRKTPFLTASTLVICGLVICANTELWVGLIFGRAVSGLGTSGVMTMGSVLLTDVVGVEKRGYYQSMNYAVYGIGSGLGSALGGFLVEKFGWSMVYKAQIPVAATALILLAVSIPSRARLMAINGFSHSQNPTSLHNYDWRGSVFLLTTLILLFSILTTGGNILPWSHPMVMIFGLSLIVSTGIFMMVEKRAKSPILPLHLFTSSPTRSLMVTGFMFSMINYIVMYHTTLFFQSVLLESSQEASVHLIIPSVSFTVTSVITASLITRLKTPAYTLRGSQVLLGMGVLGLCLAIAQTSDHTRLPDYIYNLALSFPTSGVGMMAPSTVLTLLNSSTKEDHAVANGCFIMMRSLGVFVAVALGTTTLQNAFELSLSHQKFDDTSRETVEQARQKVELILTLPDSIRSTVINAYSTGFTVLFGLCVLLAALIMFSLRGVSVQKLGDGTYSKQIGPENQEEDAEVEMEQIRRW
ncbi:Major facilitator superfamily domain, general substrate transporter [Penicillium digitatum]|uniref:Major facilitator superfamily domain, general substrate transporter n=1 Tax=Penicillium digitatum TaxID=36651 RepID=A0A7T7BP37_PENDI|nr:Major facilitator superfamily domain, general substrate transporter [Penicillium digitatum]